MSHLRKHAMDSTLDHAPAAVNDTVVATESGVLVNKSFGTSPSANTLVEYDANSDIIVPSTPTDANAAVSQSWVLGQIASGQTWKELVLVQEQLVDGGSGGISQAILLVMNSAPTAGDTFTISDGSTTETWTAVNGVAGANQFQVDAGAAAARTSLVTRISADSTLWDAVETSGLDNYFDVAPAAATSQIVIYRTVPVVTATADRVYGSLTSASAIEVVEFATQVKQDYVGGVESQLPGADPGAKRFGFGRAYASMSQNETHRVAENNTGFTWDSDDDTWQNVDTGATSITEGDGIDVTANKISVDASIAISAQQYGGIVVNRTANGAGTAAADAGHIAIQTDNVDLEINSSNQLAIKSTSNLATFYGFGSWASGASNDLEPTGTELDVLFGAGATGVGGWAFFVEDGTAVGSTSTFMVYKKASGVYHSVEMTA